jgi:hypothetical protein
MTVFWDVAPCILTETYDVSEMLTASDIRVITHGTRAQMTVNFIISAVRI